MLKTSTAPLAAILLILVSLSFQGCAERDASVYEPDISPPWFPSVSQAGGMVSWQTSENSTCLLLYGESRGIYTHYGYSAESWGKSHQVSLLDVEPGTYYMRIMARDPSGNEAVSDEFTFEVESVSAAPVMAYTMVDVGWGDCHFLEFPNGTVVMIDSGSWDRVEDYPHKQVIWDFLSRREIEPPDGIDYMIATHAHQDHYAGFPSLLEMYSETTFLAPAEAYVPVWSYVESALDESGAGRDSLRRDQTHLTADFLDWDPQHGVEVRVMSAGAGRYFAEDQEGDEVNCDSAVLKVSFGAVDFMLTGDAEEFVEQRMLKAYGRDLDCEVLKSGHHANNDANSEEFLEWVSPRVAFVPNSMEENDGVFDQMIIDRFLELNIDYYVSDRAYRNAGRYDDPSHGNLTVTTDGETFVVSAWR
jgi:competence protein ComEC